MQFSTLNTAFALVQGSLALSIKIYKGVGCTGEMKTIDVPYHTCVASIPLFLSYKKNGWGSNGERIGFYAIEGCNSLVYDTWARNGDYFASGRCYSIDDHPTATGRHARSVASYQG